MAQSKFQHARIAGISTVVPKKEIRLIDEAEYYGGDLKKIQCMIKVASQAIFINGGRY